MDKCFSRASERHARRTEEDYDEQVEEELEEEVRGEGMEGVCRGEGVMREWLEK